MSTMESEKPETRCPKAKCLLVMQYVLLSDQLIEEAVKCNRESDAVLLANTILVYIGVLKVFCINLDILMINTILIYMYTSFFEIHVFHFF